MYACIYLVMKYLFTCSGSVKIKLFPKKSRKRRKSAGALQNNASELKNSGETSDQSVANSDYLDGKENKGKKGQLSSLTSEFVETTRLPSAQSLIQGSSCYGDSDEDEVKKNNEEPSASNTTSEEKSVKKDNVEEQGCFIGEKKNEVKNRDVTAADEILGSVSLGHPSDTVHSPESDIKKLAEDDEQPVIPNPVTEESKMSEGVVGKLPEPRLSNSGTNEVNAKVHAENKPVLEETLVAQNSLGNGKKNDSDASSSHDASDSFENIEISNKGKEKDFNVSEIDDQNSLLQDADTEKNDVSKSLKSNNGKDIFAPENDALDPIPPDTDRFETKDVCLAISRGEDGS